MPVVLPPDLTDKLKAVNVLLQSISESPVSSIDDNPSVDVAAALATLDETTLAIQSKGWHFNREDAMEFTPNGSGEVVLPENTLWVGQAYWLMSGDPVRVAERARKLYNRENHSFTFANPVTLDLVVLLQWEELPEYARRYITIRAAKQFQGRLQGSSLVDRITDTEVGDALRLIEEREDEADPKNAIYGNKGVSNVLGNRGVRRRY